MTPRRVTVVEVGPRDGLQNEHALIATADKFAQLALGNADVLADVMEHASAGMVGVNVGVPVPREPFSFGGWNDSKFGVGDITGRGSIEFWTQSKKMTTKWNKEAGTNWMS